MTNSCRLLVRAERALGSFHPMDFPWPAGCRDMAAATQDAMARARALGYEPSHAEGHFNELGVHLHPLDFQRQPQPVKLTLEGEPEDVEATMRRFMRWIEGGAWGRASAVRQNNIVTIYPAAIND